MRQYINGKPVIRCSELNQLLSCSGSFTVAALAGERDDDEASWPGQWCHYEAAKALVAAGAQEPEGGLVPPSFLKSYEPTGLDRWVVDYYVGGVLADISADWAIEVEAEMIYEFSTFFLKGHVDCGAIAPDCSEASIDDLKRVINPVDAADCNWQILGYAALYQRAYAGTLRKITGRIRQPLISEDVGQKVTEMVLEGDEVANACAYLDRKVSDALARPYELDTGIKQCRWCPAALNLICPCYIKEYLDMKMTLTPEIVARLKATPDDQELAKLVAAGKLIEPALKKVRELIKERLAGGKEIVTEDGVRVFLEDKLGPREFSDAGKVEVWERLTEVVPANAAYECMSLSIEPIEKALAKQFKLPHDTTKAEKDSGKKMFAREFGSHVTRKPQTWLQVVA